MLQCQLPARTISGKSTNFWMDTMIIGALTQHLYIARGSWGLGAFTTQKILQNEAIGGKIHQSMSTPGFEISDRIHWRTAAP